QTLHREQFADRNGNRARLGSHAEKSAPEVSVSPDFRLGDQAVYRIVELCRNRYCIRALERGLNEERRCNVAHVSRTVMQSFNEFFTTSRNRHCYEVQSLAGEISFTFRDQQR